MTAIEQAIQDAQVKWLADNTHRQRWQSIRASGIDDACERRLYYYLTVGDMVDTPPELQAIFAEGNDQEPAVRRFLSELGFELKKAGITESWSSMKISGSIDGTLEWNGEKYIAEIKTCSDYSWEKLQTIDDFRGGFYRKWYGQMQTYLLLFEYEKGIFILKRESAKQIRIVECALNYEYAESLLKKAETVNAHLKSGVPPPYLSNNPVECKRCPFYEKVCTPPLDFGDAIPEIHDEELVVKLEHRAALEEAKREFDSLDKELKERFKDIPLAICGNFSVTGKAGIRHMKAQEEHDVSIWTVKFEALKTTGILS